MKRILCLICLGLFFSSFAFGGTWKGLNPGVSKKTDVDRVLGSPIKEVIKGERYDYNPNSQDRSRISIKFSKNTQIIESIDIYLKTQYDKSQYREWFELGEPAKKEMDANGNLVEYYLPQKVSLHYTGANASNPVEFFSHFAPAVLEREKVAKPSPQKKVPEQERSVYSKPTPIEPPRVIPEVKMGISYIGIEIQNLTKEVADSVGLTEGAGVLVKSVKPGGPAESAGILPGDVILRFKDTWVTDARILSELVKSTPSGTSSPVYIDRRGKRYHLTLVVGGLKKEDLSLTPTPPPQEIPKSLPPPSQQARVQERQYYVAEAKQALENKDFRKLRRILDEGLPYYPDSAALWSYEGAYYFLYNESGQFSFRREKALMALKKAIQIEPSGKCYVNLGLVYANMFKDYSSALDCYEKAGDHVLSYPRAYYLMAICYEELKYLHLAVSHYEKFLQAAPNDQYAQDARNRLARLR